MTRRGQKIIHFQFYVVYFLQQINAIFASLLLWGLKGNSESISKIDENMKDNLQVIFPANVLFTQVWLLCISFSLASKRTMDPRDVR